MKVAVFTGPTGGHFFPALAFLESFRERNPNTEFLFVTSRRGEGLVEAHRSRIQGEIAFLSDFPFPRPRGIDFLIRFPGFLLKLANAFCETRKLLKTFNPNVTIGFGSYVSFPGIWESRRKKIPTLIHEQNRRMGRANRWLARQAGRIALSFGDNNLLPPTQAKEVVGLPLRSSLVEASREKKRDSTPLSAAERVKILIVGGSQGSHSLNRLWMEAFSLFSREEKCRLAVIHITGKEDFEMVQTAYANETTETWVVPFHSAMEELYSSADLALTRAGASTLFELALFGLPAVVLPYPHADRHQEENARFFADEGAVVLLKEEECDGKKLKDQVWELVKSSSMRNWLRTNASRLARPDSAERLAQLAEVMIRMEPDRKR